MLPKSVENLIDEFSKLPGIGPKTAARLTFYLLTKPKEEIEQFGRSLTKLADNLCYCEECYNICDERICRICSDDKRDKNIIMVVEEPLDVIALERTGGYMGVYHVLGGAISPINGVGPEQLRIGQLLNRVREGDIEEIILSTNPNLEGEATAAYIKEKISASDQKTRITRIARGLPVGGDLEYADEVTLRRSLEGRNEY